MLQIASETGWGHSRLLGELRKFGRKHFNHIVREYVTYYLKHHQHQGVGNQLIGAEPRTASTESVTVDSIQ